MNEFASPAFVLRGIGLLALAIAFVAAVPSQTVVEPGVYPQTFRSERTDVAGGSEIVTIFSSDEGGDIPLVSVLRDTLGDDMEENDRLRYVWLHSYTRPSLSQKLSAFVPFLYMRTTNNKKIGSDPPPAVIDVQQSNKAFWNKLMWLAVKRLAFADAGVGFRASSAQYRQNAGDYRKAAVAGALTVLALYQEMEREKVLTRQELHDIQARLYLNDKPFGWHLGSEHLERVYKREIASTRDYRGHNWELLRQYSEAQGLYFDPLEMPDGTARHAIVWTTAEDIAANRSRKFERRFLNIKSPWGDDRLRHWKGYTEVRWFDAEDREVEAGTPGAVSRTFIPLALYGLDDPKIPLILVDFRDASNPKFREMSKRILTDVTTNVLTLSKFSSLPYFLGRLVYEFVPSRRGMDLNQASRLRSYAQLKMLLAMDESLGPELRDDIAKGVESSTLNPLGNDSKVEIAIARRQYANLKAYAARPDGLSAKVERDRREEMVRLKHGKHARTWYAIANALTFGKYTHRETSTPELVAQMDMRRQLDYHERYIREVAYASANPDIDADVPRLKAALAFVAENGEAAGGKTSKSIAKIFAMSKEDSLQTLCLNGLYRINNSSAKNELLSIYKNVRVDDRWRDLSAQYLMLAKQEGQRMTKSDTLAVQAMTTAAN